MIFMGYLSKNQCSKSSTQLTWNFLKKNYSKFLDRYAKNILLGRLIKVFVLFDFLLKILIQTITIDFLADY